MAFQKIEVLGTIGKDAEIKNINNKSYLSFSVAVDNGKDAQGNLRPSTWFEVLYSYNQQTQAWLVGRLVKKSKVYVSGRVNASAYVNKENQAVSSLGIYAQNVEPIGIIMETAQQSQSPQQSYAPQAPQGFAPQPTYAPQGYSSQPQQAYAPQYGQQAPPQGFTPQAPQSFAPQGGQSASQQSADLQNLPF